MYIEAGKTKDLMRNALIEASIKLAMVMLHYHNITHRGEVFADGLLVFLEQSGLTHERLGNLDDDALYKELTITHLQSIVKAWIARRVMENNATLS